MMDISALTSISVAHVPIEIVQTAQNLAKRLAPQRIILFGSHAYGIPREDSDIDLLLVMNNIPQRDIQYQLARDISHIAKLKNPLQLVFIRGDEFDETKDVIGGIAYPAHHWGKVLYAKNS